MPSRSITSRFRQLAAVPTQWVRRDVLTVFNYHQVSPAFDPSRHLHVTWTALDHFVAQLRQIVSHFRILPLNEAIHRLRTGSLRGRCAAITFDDGDLSVEEYVVPLLRRERIPATLFINSAYWDQEQRLHWVYVPRLLDPRLLDGDLKEHFSMLRQTRDPALYRDLRQEVEAKADAIDYMGKYFMSKSFLETLEPELFSIGLHGHEHQRFAMMPGLWQRQCIQANIDHLADLPGYVPIFAVPFGRPYDWDQTVVELCSELSLELVLADGGLNTVSAGPWPRIPVDGVDVMDAYRRALVGW